MGLAVQRRQPPWKELDELRVRGRRNKTNSYVGREPLDYFHLLLLLPLVRGLGRWKRKNILCIPLRLFFPSVIF
jgi:hypothetical protein